MESSITDLFCFLLSNIVCFLYKFFIIIKNHTIAKFILYFLEYANKSASFITEL